MHQHLPLGPVNILPLHKQCLGGRPEAPRSIEMHTRYAEDADWRALDRNVRTLRHNMNSHELEPDSPDLIQAAKDVEFAEELLQLRESQLDRL